MGQREHKTGDRVLRWGYWIMFVVLAIGAARTLYRLGQRFGWF